MAEKKKGIRIVIVVEDSMMERFCREALLKLGYHKREIRPERAPRGKGSGKQWVDKLIVIEVMALRRKRHQTLAVLVGSDVDEMTLDDRVLKLKTSLQEAGVKDRRDDERIAYWLPKWSIETWLKRLNGEDVDEDTRYKHQVKSPEYKAIAESFIQHYRKGDPLGLSSLEFAFTETPRIEN